MQRLFVFVFVVAVVAAFAAFVLGGKALAQPHTIVAMGDSLTAGYGLARADSFPAQLERALHAKGYRVKVRNGGVSGDTTAMARGRTQWTLGGDADAVIVALGANDMLRGLSPASARANLMAIMETIREQNLPVLLAGFRAPTNYGTTYTQAFDGIYPALAKHYDALLYPFFLQGVALRPSLNQPDGIHPSEEGVARIVEGILPYVEALLAQVGG